MFLFACLSVCLFQLASKLLHYFVTRQHSDYCHCVAFFVPQPVGTHTTHFLPLPGCFLLLPFLQYCSCFGCSVGRKKIIIHNAPVTLSWDNLSLESLLPTVTSVNQPDRVYTETHRAGSGERKDKDSELC